MSAQKGVLNIQQALQQQLKSVKETPVQQAARLKLQVQKNRENLNGGSSHNVL